MKTRPAVISSPAISPNDRLPTGNPDAVGQVASMGDTTDAPHRGQAPDRMPQLRAFSRQVVPEPPYTGEDRRATNRRTSALPTMLDTRKSGLERRQAGRISLKV